MATTNYCECDNTHLNNNTCCQWCWEHGKRHYADDREVCKGCETLFDPKIEGTDTHCQECCDWYAENIMEG